MAQSDASGDIIKVVLIGGAAYVAYLLYENYIASAVPGTVAPTNPAPAGGTTAGTTGSSSGTTGTTQQSSGTAPKVPATCGAPISHTCPDGSVITQMPTNPPACTIVPDQGWSACPVPSPAAQTQNVVNAGNLAQTLNARAISDGPAKGSLLPASSGYTNGQVAYTPQQWNYIMNELYPGSTTLPSSANVMSSAQYVLARTAAFGQAGYTGLTGLGQFIRVGRNTLRTGGRQPIRNYVRTATPMRRAG
jgi:hypothetical protein